VKVIGNQGVFIYGVTITVNVGNDGSVLDIEWMVVPALMNSASLSERTIPALNEQNGPNPDLSFSGQNQWGNRTAVGSESF